MIRSLKIRLYPTKEQEELMWKHIDSCRFIWNYVLNIQKERYIKEEPYLQLYDVTKLLKPLKQREDYKWLYEVSTASLLTVCRDLDSSYRNKFKKVSGFPKFKSKKKSKKSFPIRNTLYFKDKQIAMIEKIGKIKYKTDYKIPLGRGNIKAVNPRVSNVQGKWLLSFGIECEKQANTLTDINMGIDLGIKNLAVVEFDQKPIIFHNINKSKKIRDLKKREKYLQRSISRKYRLNKRGQQYYKTNNIRKKEEQLNKVRQRIANIRQNYIHQTTHQLVLLLPKRIVMEDLNVQGMMKNKHLSRAIGEQCFNEFLRQMSYKCENYGIEFVQVDRFFPSSKTCSCCGSVKKSLKLNERIYKCEECGIMIDRDYNAAINLSKYIV